MSFETKRQLRTKISELQAKIDIYEMAINNAGLSVLKEKKPKHQDEFGFTIRKKSK